MAISHEHVGWKISAKIKIYILSRAKLLCSLWQQQVDIPINANNIKNSNKFNLVVVWNLCTFSWNSTSKRSHWRRCSQIGLLVAGYQTKTVIADTHLAENAGHFRYTGIRHIQIIEILRWFSNFFVQRIYAAWPITRLKKIFVCHRWGRLFG